MKKSILLSFLYASMLFISCSDNDDTESSSFNIPLFDGNYWTYDVNSAGTLTRDSLFISRDEVINTKTYKNFKLEMMLQQDFIHHL